MTQGLRLVCIAYTGYRRPIRGVGRYINLIAMTVIVALTSTAQTNKNCLDQIHSPSTKIAANTAAFDKQFDRVNASNASFSCYLFIPASRARDAIESFRYGVIYKDKLSLERAMQYPLTVILNESPGGSTGREKITVHNYDEWLKIQESKMTRVQREMIRCSWLGSVTLVGGQSFNPGFIINDGLVFFATNHAPEVRITSIDLVTVTDEMLERACADSEP